MVNEKIVSFRIRPYYQESIVQIIMDFIVIGLISIVLFIAKFPTIVCIAVIMVYGGIAVILHYRTTIHAIVDKRKGNYITEIVSIKEFSSEYSFAGDRLGRSHIRFFYPSKMHIGKHRIKVANNQGEEKRLRSVMSFRRIAEFAILDKHQIERLKVTYLEKSKILLYVELVDDIDKIISRKKKDSIKKAVHFINSSI